MSEFTRFLDVNFSKNSLNERHKFIQGIKAFHPNSQHVPLFDSQFALVQFLDNKDIKIERSVDEMTSLYSADRYSQANDVLLTESTISSVMKFMYEGVPFIAYQIEMSPTDHAPRGLSFWDLVFDPPADAQPQESVGEKLIKAVYSWHNEIHEGAIWVYDNVGWVQDVQLSSDIKSSSWDTLVLDESFIKGLKRDTHTFFSSEKIYQKLGITWKRGLLLLGPPGNGKTESIKALLNDTAQPALYVKTFSSMMGSPEFAIGSIFDHARKHAPCILIIEDLDTMITPMVRSFFLNELDGLVKNHGILTIATSNHPELIDDAILNRPSRFDVKYNFALPNHELRKQFAVKWVRKLRDLESDPDIGNIFERSDDAEIAEDVAKKTNGWSFAFLKELFLSFLLRIAHDKSRNEEELGPADIEHMLFDQIVQLDAQISRTKETGLEL